MVSLMHTSCTPHTHSNTPHIHLLRTSPTPHTPHIHPCDRHHTGNASRAVHAVSVLYDYEAKVVQSGPWMTLYVGCVCEYMWCVGCVSTYGVCVCW